MAALRELNSRAKNRLGGQDSGAPRLDNSRCTLEAPLAQLYFAIPDEAIDAGGGFLRLAANEVARLASKPCIGRRLGRKSPCDERVDRWRPQETAVAGQA
eukprot:scaffold183929_cov30-Tisochrysis_lutea.AAC.4